MLIYKTKYAPQDPFGDVIKKIMHAIHQHAELSPTCDLGSQNYEQWVVQKERKGGQLFLMLILRMTSS